MNLVKLFKYCVGQFRIFCGGLIRDSRELRDRYPQYEIGRGCYGPLDLEEFGDHGKIKIGAFCSFAKGVTVLLGGEHRSEWVTTYPFDRKYFNDKLAPHSSFARGDVVIGNDVWIGRDALILSGAVIGNGAIIGARSVVRGVVPPYAIVAGMPAKVLRYRFSDEVIAELQKMSWWDWSDDKIKRKIPLLMMSPDIELIRGDD